MKERYVKIIIPILILGVLLGMWFYKNQQETQEQEEEQAIIEELVDENFALAATSIDMEALVAYGLPIIIDFGADYCVPCQAMEPILEAVNREMQERAIIKFVDTGTYPEIASDFPIQVIPTQVFYNPDGTPYVPSEEIVDLGIEFTMYSTKDTEEHVFTVHQGGLTEEQMYTILADMGAE